MPGSHRKEPPLVADGYDVTAVLRVVRLVLAAVNACIAMAFVAAPSGTAPSITLLQAVVGLPVWAVVFGAVAVLLAIGVHIPGHLLGAPLWLFWALGAVLGLVGGTSRSPAVTVALTALILAMAALHVHGLVWRRREAQARRAS
jgi:hypothetical protein